MAEDDSTLLLDEENEVYGYGVYNVVKDVFVPELGITSKEGFSEEEVREHFKNVTEGQEKVSHLRIVEIRLSNELDKELVEEVRASE